MVRAEVERQANPYSIMVVDSVQENGLVNLRWGEAIINGVAANVSYSPRAEGDVVLVLNHSAGWRVMDKIGGPVQVDIPEPVDLEFGPSAPPADFVQVNALYMKDGAIYGQTGEGPGPGPGDPPKASKPKPVTLDPSSIAAYRSGRRDGSRPHRERGRATPKRGVRFFFLAAGSKTPAREKPWTACKSVLPAPANPTEFLGKSARGLVSTTKRRHRNRHLHCRTGSMGPALVWVTPNGSLSHPHKQPDWRQAIRRRGDGSRNRKIELPHRHRG